MWRIFIVLGQKDCPISLPKVKENLNGLGGEVNFWLDWSEVYYIIDM